MERIKINLVSKKPLKTKKAVKYGGWVFFLLAFLVGLYEVWIYAETKICIKQHILEIEVKKKLSQNRDMPVVEKKSISESELNALKSMVEMRNRIILGYYFRCSKILDRLEYILPDTMFFDKLDVNLKDLDNKQLKITGSAKDFEGIARFMNNLENSDFFRNTFLLNQDIEKSEEHGRHLKFFITTEVCYTIQ